MYFLAILLLSNFYLTSLNCLTFPRIVYVETQKEILKPVTVRDKDDIKYIGGEIDVYKLERNKNEIKFINNNESYHLNDDPF